MFCKNCGQEIPDGVRFCTHCGTDQQYDSQSVSRPAYDGQRPPAYLVLSILVTLACCVPFGIVGIVYASKVDPAWNAGNYEDARTFSRKARNWSVWGIVISCFWWVLYIILLIAGVTWAAWWDIGEQFFA